MRRFIKLFLILLVIGFILNTGLLNYSLYKQLTPVDKEDSLPIVKKSSIEKIPLTVKYTPDSEDKKPVSSIALVNSGYGDEEEKDREKESNRDSKKSDKEIVEQPKDDEEETDVEDDGGPYNFLIYNTTFEGGIAVSDLWKSFDGKVENISFNKGFYIIEREFAGNLINETLNVTEEQSFVLLNNDCITIGYGHNMNKLRCAYIKESRPNDNYCCYVNPPIYREVGDDYDENAMVEFDFDFNLNSITVTSAKLYFTLRGEDYSSADGYARFHYSTAKFDPTTVTWNNAPAAYGMWESSNKIYRDEIQVESTTDLSKISSGFHDRGAYYRLRGGVDSDDEVDMELLCASNHQTYLEICYSGTPVVCNPSEPCCSSDGYSYKPAGTGCGPVLGAVCDTADMDTCDGHATQDQCTGSSADCPDNNVLIDYDAACSGTDVGTCAKCDGGSVPVLDEDHDDCESYDCDHLDNGCRDYSDVQMCVGVNSCADQDSYCNVYTDAPEGTSCGTCGSCNSYGDCEGDVIECNNDLDCDDSSPYTRDSCINPGICGAYCENANYCGNGRCDGDENAVSCPQDCLGDEPQPPDEPVEGGNLIYDSTGNLMGDLNYRYGYDGFNQLSKVLDKEDNVLEEYFYDDQGGRVKKVSYNDDGSSTTTYYPDPNFVRVVDNSGTHDTIFYYDSSALVGRKDSNGSMYFYHPDHLGSTNVVTGSNGDVVERTTYEPFGNVLGGGDSRYLFTGKEKDSTGLMYYEARYYNPFTAHFTQADTMIGDVYDPLQLNRYSYARNNPVKYMDPSGHVLVAVNPFTLLLGESGVGYFNPYSNLYRFPTPYENIFRPGVGIDLPIVDPLPVTYRFPFPSENLNPFESNYVDKMNPKYLDFSRDLINKDYHEMQRKEFYRKWLPKAGFKNIKKYEKRGDIKLDKKGRAVDRKGNKWKWDSDEKRFHKYYSDKYGDYENIDPDGQIRHKGQSNRPVTKIFEYFVKLYDDFTSYYIIEEGVEA